MILDILSAGLLLAGVFFSLTGALGIFKLPDFFIRIHAASVTDSMATLLIIGGLMLRSDSGLVAIKLLFILIFLLLTSPTASHALAKSARHGGLLTLPESQSKAQANNMEQG